MIIAIVGPTGVGKTKLSIELAKAFNGEIINADSMQFYKNLDIGTAKIRAEEKEGIPHHLFDILDIKDNYSIFEYQKDAREKIMDITARKKIPIIIGGTGLYIKSALYDYNLSKEIKVNTYDDLETEELYDKLIKLDKNIQIDKNNRRRLIRALNYYLENNESINSNKTDKMLYDTIFIGLTTNREILYEKINLRVDKMLDNGLLREVEAFYKQNIKSKPIINGIGYKELYAYFDNEISLDEAINKIKQNSRNYAKRQYTFFKNQLPVKWFEVDYNNFSKTIEEVKKYIEDVK